MTPEQISGIKSRNWNTWIAMKEQMDFDREPSPLFGFARDFIYETELDFTSKGEPFIRNLFSPFDPSSVW